jgi:rhodanese-related sulfurtransferase
MSYEHVSAEEAIGLAAGDSVLVDVRETWEWEKGHAAEAISLPMSELQTRVGELDKDATLLIICHSGQRSMSVTDWLDDAGYSAINVDGGMIAWHAAGGSVVSQNSDDPRV